MEITITKEKKTPLLSRKRVVADLQYKGTTPSKENIQENIAKMNNIQKDCVEIRHVYTRYGQQHAKVIVHIYEDPTVMNKVIKKGKKQKEKEQKKAAQEELIIPAKNPENLKEEVKEKKATA